MHQCQILKILGNDCDMYFQLNHFHLQVLPSYLWLHEDVSSVTLNTAGHTLSSAVLRLYSCYSSNPNIYSTLLITSL